MRLFRFICLLSILTILCGSSRAQDFRSLREKWFETVSDTLILDSLSVVPGSLLINGMPSDSNLCTLYPWSSKLVWKKKPMTDRVKIQYRVYPFALTAAYFHKDIRSIRDDQGRFVANPFIYEAIQGNSLLFDFGGLDYNGNFSRGISFGSNQDLVLNSAFNLQLSGMIARDLEVVAAITDNNVPFQPEGNTQQVQEFDKIFIQLKRKQHAVTVGDFDLYNNGTYFLRYSKKPRGGLYQGLIPFKEEGKLNVMTAGGIMRGRFARNFLRVNEGNQGPYKLSGANGESLIIILANSEEVFVNGEKMQRGADRDYVIDYNLGEVTFTPRRLITNNMRVTVEFEYTDRNYMRSAAMGSFTWEQKKYAISLNVYSEQDAKSQTTGGDLTGDRRKFLESVGDSIQNAFYRGWDTVAWDPNRVLYRMRDTILPSGLYIDSVFEYSTSPEEGRYAVTFSLVGQGRGDYVPAANLANGRVYQWVAPLEDTLTGRVIPQGTYAPVVILVSPKMEQMYTLGGVYRINRRHQLEAEVALSYQDINTLSNKNNADNAGTGIHLAYNGSAAVGKDSVRAGELMISTRFEFRQNRFQPIERYRQVEFARDWNTGLNDNLRNEFLSQAEVSYRMKKSGIIGARFNSFVRQNIYRGFQYSIISNLNPGSWQIRMNHRIMHSTGESESSMFARPEADISYGIIKLKGLRAGFSFNHEINSRRHLDSDTLSGNSFLWQNYTFYLKQGDSLGNNYGLTAELRYEHRPEGIKFGKPVFRGRTATAYGQFNTLKNQQIQFTMTYRRADGTDSAGAEVNPQNFYLGRLNYILSGWKGLIRSTTFYEIGSGRQQKVQLSFQPSPTNQGEYIWKDANGDGIKQIDEFVISQFREDTSYFRIFTTVPEFIAVNQTLFNQVIQINPASVIRETRGWMGFLRRFSLFGSVQLSKKVFASSGKKVRDYFNPVPLKREDSDLVSLQIASRNTLFFNKMDPDFGFQIDYNYNNSRTLLTSGFENRLNWNTGFLSRWNISKSISWQQTYSYGRKSNRSDFYRQQQYNFNFHQGNTDWTYQHKTNWRISLIYDIAWKQNPLTDTVLTQDALQQKIQITGRYNRLNKSTIEASFAYASVRYRDQGLINQQLEYAMLEGLRNGNNLVWNLTFEQRLTGAVQLLISYDGRKTGNTGTVHTGRAELRAMF